MILFSPVKQKRYLKGCLKFNSYDKFSAILTTKKRTQIELTYPNIGTSLRKDTSELLFLRLFSEEQIKY